MDALKEPIKLIMQAINILFNATIALLIVSLVIVKPIVYNVLNLLLGMQLHKFALLQ